MFPYYGAKTNIVHRYPAPIFDTIIEPFAGSARYALKYWDRRVILMEKNKMIFGVWKYLQQATISDIGKLPHRLESGDRLSNYTFSCTEELNFMSLLIEKGGPKSSRDKVSDRIAIHRPNHINYTLNRIAGCLHRIVNWDIRHGDYREIENIKATWFIDPPYQKTGGMHCPHGSKNIDYHEFGLWSMQRKGQIIVCENERADWLPFRPFTSQQSGAGKKVQEFLYTSHPFMKQLEMFDSVT
jgi:site-specific DNA-adenine methylase